MDINHNHNSSPTDADICMGGMDSDIVMTVMDAQAAEEEFGCRSCGRLVCDVCAVVGEGKAGWGKDGRREGGWERDGRMGESGWGRDGGRGREPHWGNESERECLGCTIERGRKGVRWIGGIGWMP